jgi:bifunctional non-homologous end joining protein LigD
MQRAVGAAQPPRHRGNLPVAARLRSRSRIIDGEAVACDENGVASFNLVRYRHHDESIFLYAFDLIELNGDDMRRDPFETRKATLASLLKRAAPGLRLNEHIEADGPTGRSLPL